MTEPSSNRIAAPDRAPYPRLRRRHARADLWRTLIGDRVLDG